MAELEAVDAAARQRRLGGAVDQLARDQPAHGRGVATCRRSKSRLQTTVPTRPAGARSRTSVAGDGSTGTRMPTEVPSAAVATPAASTTVASEGGPAAVMWFEANLQQAASTGHG